MATPETEPPLRRVAHLSDPHLFEPGALRPWHALDKRLLGGLNALARRRRIHRREITVAALQAIAELRPDHLVVSGDITTLGAEAEMAAFARLLGQTGLSPRDVTVVPGNHDAYVASIQRSGAFARIFEAFQRPEPPFEQPGWPRVRLCGELAIIACDTARPSGPLLALGTLGVAQRARLEAVLADPRLANRFRLVVLHHPPQPGVGHWHNRLTDAAELREVLARTGAELVVHGHLHRPLSAALQGPDGPVPVRGVSSVSSADPRPERWGAFRVYRVRGRSLVGEQRWVVDRDRLTFRPLEADSNPAA